VARRLTRLGSFALASAALSTTAVGVSAAPCRGEVYLTLDTGNMARAEEIAATLKRHDIKATFFVANEKTMRGDGALEAGWSDYWKQRVAEGHAFGSHTLRHGRILGDAEGGGVTYRPQFGEAAGKRLTLDADALCREIRAAGERFEAATGQRLDALWRAPGGRVTRNALQIAQGCGYSHVHWAASGFLGDELPSDRYPNAMLLERALRDIRDGDVLMAHLGIWSRKEPFAPMLDPLIAGLKERGFCFRTLREHPQYRRSAVAAALDVQRRRPSR
jgi:peptidoglycan/xylan/chitin deacetylase (PgdA/CDA1 family)